MTELEKNLKEFKDLTREYLRLKKLGKASVIPMQEGKRRRDECLRKMAKLAGYKL